MYYHVARRIDWDTAGDTYTVSTLGKSFGEVGFVHLSLAHQVKPVADRVYCQQDDLVLLAIEPARLDGVVKFEGETDELYPHLYAPLNMNAVVAVEPYTLSDDGTFPIVVD